MLDRPTLIRENWDRLLEKADISLNLLRPSRLNPKFSAYSQLIGTFNYNITPMDPPGTRILLHDKLHNRGTWAPHRQEGWYIHPAMRHYHCLTYYIPKTASERVSDTTDIFTVQKQPPSLYPEDALTHLVADLIEALQNPPPQDQARTLKKHTASLLQLASIFNTEIT